MGARPHSQRSPGYTLNRRKGANYHSTLRGARNCSRSVVNEVRKTSAGACERNKRDESMVGGDVTGTQVEFDIKLRSLAPHELRNALNHKKITIRKEYE